MARRSAMSSPWHNCTRCSRKTHLSEMKRERGILVCLRPSCLDTSLIGERDARISKAVNSNSVTTEMQPHPLISGPQMPSEEDIFF